MPLTQLPRAIVTRSSGLLRVLPDMLAALRAIEHYVTSLDREVRRMRQGVDALNTRVEALGEQAAALNDKIDRLEQTASGVRADLRPWRRTRSTPPSAAASGTEEVA